MESARGLVVDLDEFITGYTVYLFMLFVLIAFIKVLLFIYVVSYPVCLLILEGTDRIEIF